ncbi:5'-adenylylsulfate reductase-like 3 isoform X2 [Wolffia australiana]
MAGWAWRRWAGAMVVVFCVLEKASGISVAEKDAICPLVRGYDSFLAGVRGWCPAWRIPAAGGSIADLVVVTEGKEAILQQALNIVQENKNDYVALLFYASWCPFSKACKPNFSSLSLLFPSIRHFAFEESAIRPSILSKYGVHGFPTLFLINSTMRIRYHGPRDVPSLVSFYNDVTGIPLRPLDSASWKKIHPLVDSCPFSWARSPEKLLREDTWLALAVAFVTCRVVFLLAPAALSCGRRAWRRHISPTRWMRLWDGFVEKGGVFLGKLRLNPCRRHNLQEGAKIWAPHSLVPLNMRGGRREHD